jgi:hypothetical protein
MLRISGIVALLASSALSVGLFCSVQTLRITGTAWNFGSPPLHIRVDTGPGSPVLLSWKTPGSLPASIGSDDAHRVVGLGFDEEYEAIREIPHEARVVITHRGIESRRLHWAFGSTQCESEGRTYILDRSPAHFHWTLGLVSASPVLLWLAAILFTVFLRPPQTAPLRVTEPR